MTSVIRTPSSLIQTLNFLPSESVLERFDCTAIVFYYRVLKKKKEIYRQRGSSSFLMQKREKRNSFLWEGRSSMMQCACVVKLCHQICLRKAGMESVTYVIMSYMIKIPITVVFTNKL